MDKYKSVIKIRVLESCHVRRKEIQEGKWLLVELLDVFCDAKLETHAIVPPHSITGF